MKCEIANADALALFCVIRLVGRARLQTELMFAAFPDSVVEPCRHKAAGNAYDK